MITIIKPIEIEFEEGVLTPEPEIKRQQEWSIIPVDKMPNEKTKQLAHRLNGLGSMFYFGKVILRKRRFTEHFHKPLCDGLEKSHLKDVYEIPRDHFKSTICSEVAPMWWALPFTLNDEAVMRSLGYGDEWIIWMRRAHNPDTRTLLVSSNITNAAKLGKRINGSYDSNDFFRTIYPEILPDSSCTWSDFTKTHKRTSGHTPQGEGTYDFLGVNSALQSRHYDRMIQDDLVGKDAYDSPKVMEGVIEYHKLLVGAFDSDPASGGKDNDELVVGNRWSYIDLNSHIRAEEPYFRIVNHSALGGCCPAHIIGKPIFPEEFNYNKLMRWQKRLGSYLFSCQFLNQPTQPGDAVFKEENLRYYEYKHVSDSDHRVKIVHDVHNGKVLADIMPSHLNITMVVDPNHSGLTGRCRHAIAITGYSMMFERAYLLEYWAASASYDDFFGNIYKLADKWKLEEFWLETIAAQKYIKYHIDYRNRIENRKLKVNELKSARTDAAKKIRIESFAPLYENNQFYCQRRHTDFLAEYNQYPFGKTVDILDTIGYAPQTWTSQISGQDFNSFVNANKPPIPQGKCGY